MESGGEGEVSFFGHSRKDSRLFIGGSRYRGATRPSFGVRRGVGVGAHRHRRAGRTRSCWRAGPRGPPDRSLGIGGVMVTS